MVGMYLPLAISKMKSPHCLFDKMAPTEILIGRTTLKVLQYSLLWPNEKEEMNPGKWYYIRIMSFLIITSAWVASVLMHLVTTLKAKADLGISEDIAFMVAFFGTYYVTINYVKNQPKVALLMRDLSNFETFGKPPGFEEELKNLSFWSKVCFIYPIVGIIIYSSTKLLERPECEKINIEKGLRQVCGMLSPMWVPFKIQGFPRFHLVFIFVFISSQILLKLVLTISFNMFEMAHHIILRINHLKIMIVESFDNEDYEISRERLKKCILYHLEILNFAKRLDDCFSNGMFAHLTLTAAICGCLEKQYTAGDSRIGALLHVFGWFMALFVACTGGQHLLDSSTSFPEAIYSSKWYQTDLRLRRDLGFVLLRSQRNLFIRAGPFGVLSFPLFVSVLKMSYSILAMLTS